MAYKQQNNTDNSSGSMSDFNAHDPKFEAKYMDEYLEHEYLNGGGDSGNCKGNSSNAHDPDIDNNPGNEQNSDKASNTRRINTAPSPTTLTSRPAGQVPRATTTPLAATTTATLVAASSATPRLPTLPSTTSSQSQPLTHWPIQCPWRPQNSAH